MPQNRAAFCGIIASHFAAKYLAFCRIIQCDLRQNTLHYAAKYKPVCRIMQPTPRPLISPRPNNRVAVVAALLSVSVAENVCG
jgi:hypothetical protein